MVCISRLTFFGWKWKLIGKINFQVLSNQKISERKYIFSSNGTKQLLIVPGLFFNVEIFVWFLNRTYVSCTIKQYFSYFLLQNCQDEEHK